MAMALYCQLPFGKLHRGNPAIVALAEKLGRTPSAVAMKLVNFASLDPAITQTGRKGLGNASALDREVWDAFKRNWEGEMTEAALELDAVPNLGEMLWEEPDGPVETEKRALVAVRTKQQIFRRMILANYSFRCCMSGLTIERCLVASHIVRWSDNEAARLNPHNGLCLSALHDKAYEYGYLTITPDFVVKASGQLKKLGEIDKAAEALAGLDGVKIAMPEKFMPDKAFLETHLKDRYLRE